MKFTVFVAVLLLAGWISVFSAGRLFEMHKAEQATQFNRLIYFPDSIVKTGSLGFPGVVADYLLLNLMVIHGEKLLKEIMPTREEWQSTYIALKKIIFLDPRFRDPYVFAQMSLPWDAGMVKETNDMLLQAAEMRPDDYEPYFFLWFNYYYFLHDPKTAGMYLQKAAAKPGVPRYYTTLAARMNLYGGDIRSGIVFLSEMLEKTNDPMSKKYWQIRLECLKKIAFLEGKVKKYKDEFHMAPGSLDELILKGLLDKVPEDPYGGQFFINEKGRVYTTSKMVFPPKNN